MEIFPAISVNKDVTWSATAALQCEPVAWGNWGKKRITALAALRLQPLPTLIPEETRELRCTSKDDFRESRLWELPICKKVPNFLSWSIWFSLINSNLLMCWTIPSVAKSLYTLAPLLPPLSTLSDLRWCLTCCSPHLASHKALTLCVSSRQFQSLPGPDVLITALYCLEQPYIWTHDLLGVHLETKCKYLAQFLLISKVFEKLVSSWMLYYNLAFFLKSYI